MFVVLLRLWVDDEVSSFVDKVLLVLVEKALVAVLKVELIKEVTDVWKVLVKLVLEGEVVIVGIVAWIDDVLVLDEEVLDEVVVDESVLDESVLDESVLDEEVVDESVVDVVVVDDDVVLAVVRMIDEAVVDVVADDNDGVVLYVVKTVDVVVVIGDIVGHVSGFSLHFYIK
jgi:hypothetical protein